MTQEISIWIKKIVILIGLAILGYLLYKIGSILFILIISGFLTVILNPLINIGEKYHIPAWITLVGVYIVVLIL